MLNLYDNKTKSRQKIVEILKQKIQVFKEGNFLSGNRLYIFLYLNTFKSIYTHLKYIYFKRRTSLLGSEWSENCIPGDST